MKNHLFLLLLLLGGLSLGIQSCNPDSSDDSDPTSKALTGSGLSTNNDSLKIGSVTKISIKAVRGGNPLKTISVKVNGIDLVAGTFNINGSSAFANPVLLFGADRDSLVYAYEFTRIDTPQSLSYEFTITDEADKKTTQTVNIKYYGTPSVESGKGLAVYNYSGTKFGGLDLFNAKVVSGNAPEATIRDYGVVDPVSDKTWVMRFSPLNNSEIMNPPANFTYAGLVYQENIKRAFELGSREAGLVTTKVLAKGDFFLVRNGTTYFAVSIDKVVTTANDNNDYYEVSIKN